MNNTLILNPPFIIKGNLSFKWKISLRIVWVLGILSIVALLTFYIFQVNAEVSERYLIQKYEKRTSEIAKENQDLEISSIKTNSLENITGLVDNLNFEKIDKIHYIKVLDSQIVTK